MSYLCCKVIIIIIIIIIIITIIIIIISCGADVNIHGTHGLSCRFSKGRHSRHASINDIIKRALESAKVPCHLEPTGLFRSDGKRQMGPL